MESFHEYILNVYEILRNFINTALVESYKKFNTSRYSEKVLKQP